MQKRNEPWYVARRTELLVEQFLLDLHADSIASRGKDNQPFDYIAFFSAPDGTPITIGVEVKSTQQSLEARIQFPSQKAQLLLKSNIPILVILVNVKTNEMYFNWIRDAIPKDKQAVLGELNSCTLNLRKSTSDELRALSNEIHRQATLVAS